MRPKSAPRHLDVWSLLPQTNCRQCGEATCLKSHNSNDINP
ncbi:MAG: (Fe-S)-binding protein [Chloroflexota bacterium]